LVLNYKAPHVDGLITPVIFTIPLHCSRFPTMLSFPKAALLISQEFTKSC